MVIVVLVVALAQWLYRWYHLRMKSPKLLVILIWMSELRFTTAWYQLIHEGVGRYHNNRLPTEKRQHAIDNCLHDDISV